MLKTARLKKQKNVQAVESNESMYNGRESFTAPDGRSIEDTVKAACNQQLPFEVLLQIMRAYSTFLAGSTVKSGNI